jgi:hypothetical protein
MDTKNIRCVGTDCIHLAQHRAQQWALVNTAKNFVVLWKWTI